MRARASALSASCGCSSLLRYRWGYSLRSGSPSHRQTDPPARQAIRRLGAGEFEGDIRVGGPADLKYLGSRLDWLRQRLIELEQQKRLFLRHVSHELKTPLTALREGSELLAEGTAGPLSSEQRENRRKSCSRRACNCSS